MTVELSILADNSNSLDLRILGLSQHPSPWVDSGLDDLDLTGRILRQHLEAIFKEQFTSHSVISEFETALANYLQIPNNLVISCSNGSDALTLALLGQGIGSQDAVIVPSHTFAASASAVVNLGATPIFADSDPATGVISKDSITKAIEGYRGGKSIRAIIAVSLYGNLPNFDQILDLAECHNLTVIEDAAQSFGAKFNGKSSGTIADFGTFSFYPSKTLSAWGDAGAIVVKEHSMAEKIRSLRDNGRGSDRNDFINVGINARVMPLQALVLLNKLSNFDSRLERRRAIAMRYDSEINPCFSRFQTTNGAECAFGNFALLHDKRDLIVNELRAQSIPVAIYYPKPLHLNLAFLEFSNESIELCVAERICRNVFNLSTSPNQSDSDINCTIQAINNIARDL